MPNKLKELISFLILHNINYILEDSYYFNNHEWMIYSTYKWEHSPYYSWYGVFCDGSDKNLIYNYIIVRPEIDIHTTIYDIKDMKYKILGVEQALSD